MPTSKRPLTRRRQQAFPRTVARVRLGLFAAALLTLGGCAQMPSSGKPAPASPAQTQLQQAVQASDPAGIARARLAMSQDLSGTERAEQQLLALETAIDAHDLQLARELYQQVDTQSLWPRINPRRAAIARGLGQWAEGDRSGAMRTIHRIPLPLEPNIEGRRLFLLGAMEAEAGDPLRAARYYHAANDLLPPKQREPNHARIWNLLLEIPTEQLRDAAANAGDSRFADWLDLALTYRQRPAGVEDWVTNHPDHPSVESGFVDMLDSAGSLESIRTPSQQGPVAVLLPHSKQYEGISQAIRQGIEYAAQNGALGGRELRFIDSGTGRLGVRAALEEAEAAGAAVVIGPLLKSQLPALGAIGPNGPLAIALNSPAPGESMPMGVVSFSLSPEQDAQAAARRMWAEGHRRVAIFSAGQQLGERTRDAFAEEFTLMGGDVVDRASFNPGQTDFSSELRNLLQVRDEAEDDGPFQPVIRNDLDAIFLAASGDELALITPQLDYFGAEELPRYGLGLAYSGNVDKRADGDKDKVKIPVAPMLLAGPAGPDHPMRPAYEQAQLAGSLPRLFAFGADAARVAGRIDALLQGGTVSGLTGELSLTPTGVIQRQPRWGQFRNGLLKPLPELGDTISSDMNSGSTDGTTGNVPTTGF
ncbi:penicillin-binding protein activator [Guyparkeria hydrothermalis]|uniref:penicillin-binding protein activator n=1 Tax=Guyparkeria hydrothermalis TaxID=923 RepID=UPI0020217EB6|nr:penicillin-binding protein activator [Guyparkeria hydrothermalis]MCL7745405.1 penicillin-binding protein activator [Guyparkeria hydrothermalis]